MKTICLFGTILYIVGVGSVGRILNDYRGPYYRYIALRKQLKSGVWDFPPILGRGWNGLVFLLVYFFVALIFFKRKFRLLTQLHY